jgi:hypothetical protein
MHCIQPNQPPCPTEKKRSVKIVRRNVTTKEKEKKRPNSNKNLDHYGLSYYNIYIYIYKLSIV